MPSNQQYHNLDDKLDDVRSSMAQLAVAQATMGGELKVLATKLEVLEADHRRNEWQAWAERLGFAIVGASGLGIAQHFLGR